MSTAVTISPRVSAELGEARRLLDEAGVRYDAGPLHLTWNPCGPQVAAQLKVSAGGRLLASVAPHVGRGLCYPERLVVRGDRPLERLMEDLAERAARVVEDAITQRAIVACDRFLRDATQWWFEGSDPTPIVGDRVWIKAHTVTDRFASTVTLHASVGADSILWDSSAGRPIPAPSRLARIIREAAHV